MPIVASPEIMSLVTDNAYSQMINDAINRTVNSIQYSIVMSELMQDIQAILNMWIRTSWYGRDRVSKFERCLRTIVTKNMMRIVITLLKEYKVGIIALDEDDMSRAHDRATFLLCHYGFSTTMQSEFLAEASRMVAKDGDRVSVLDNIPFSWINIETGMVSYHLYHVPIRIEHTDDVDIKSVEILPDDFKHKTD